MASNQLVGDTSPPRDHSPSPLLSPGATQPIYGSSYDVEMQSASRLGSPQVSEGHEVEVEIESVTCLWAGCGKPFNELKTLIEHMHNGK